MNDSRKAFNQVLSFYQENKDIPIAVSAIDYAAEAKPPNSKCPTHRTSVVKPTNTDFFCDVEISARRCLSPAEFAHWEAGYKSCVVVVNADGTPDKSLERFIRTFPEEKWAVKRIIDSRMREKLGRRFIAAEMHPISYYMEAVDVHGRGQEIVDEIGPRFDFNASADESEEHSNVVYITGGEFVGDICGAADVSFEPLLSAREAAKLLGVHEKTVQALARSGEIPCLRFGKYWKFRESSLDAWVRERLISDYQSRRVS